MKNLFLLILSFFIFVCFCQCSLVKATDRKGCSWSFTHDLKPDTLFVSTLVTGGCSHDNIHTNIDFGDGYQTSWGGSETHAHVYYSPGDYTVTISTDNPDAGTSTFTFAVEIADTIPIDLCVGDFSIQQSYDLQYGKFIVTCQRIDSCSSGDFYWYATGQPQMWGDSVTFLYPNADSGEIETICLEKNTIGYSAPVCKEVQMIVTNSDSILNEEPGVSPGIKFFPNPVIDNLNLVLPNKDISTTFTLYSFDGRRILDYSFQPAAERMEFSISMINLPSGIYFVKAIAGDEYFKVQKIVKQ